MSAAEIAYRCREKWRIQMERVQVFVRRGGLPTPAAVRPYLTKDYLAAEPARRFFAAGAAQNIGKLVRLEFPEWIARAAGEADRICNRRLQLFGHREIDLGPVVDWLADPVSGAAWPRRFWARYDLVHESGAGDPKAVLELNRHQHLITLARAYVYTEDERYAGEAIAQIDGWIDQNPRGLGINWHSSLEIGIRALSWLWVLFLLLPSKSLDDRRTERILKVLYAHFAHIHSYPSVYSSPNTHLIGEALALYVGGTVFAALKPARRWRDAGRAFLVQEARRQVLGDGLHAELSPYYHCYALEFYLMAAVLARKASDDLPDDVLDRIQRMIEALSTLAYLDGSFPRLSDDDGGRAFVFDPSAYRDVRSLMSTGAVFFGREDFKGAAQRFHEETLWLSGGDACGLFARMESRSPSRSSRLLESGGYFVSRTDRHEDQEQLVFDCGGLGFLGGGHGHADALSIVLSSGARELLVDPGAGVYNGAPEWRDYFRSTRAHNTVVIDGEDQARRGGPFEWNGRVSSTVLRRFALPGGEYIEAEHDGYSRLDNPVIHRRRLLQIRPQCWVVADDFRGAGLHQFESFYHFAPAAVVDPEPRRSLTSATLHAWNEGYGLRLALYGSSSFSTEIACGARDPIQGWFSSQYGDIQPSPVLRATAIDSVPSASIGVLMTLRPADGDDASPVMREELVDGAPGTACLSERSGIQDLFVMVLGDRPVRVADFQLRGEFFWIRSLDAQVRELFCVNASYAARGNSVLFENPTPVSCVSVRTTPDASTAVYGDSERGVHVRD